MIKQLNKIEKIIDGVFLHGKLTPDQSIDLPDGQYTVAEAIKEIMKITRKDIEGNYDLTEEALTRDLTPKQTPNTEKSWEERLTDLIKSKEWIGTSRDYKEAYGYIYDFIRKTREEAKQETLEECLRVLPEKKHITKWKSKPEGEGDKWCCRDGCEACARTQGEEMGFNCALDLSINALHSLSTAGNKIKN